MSRPDPKRVLAAHRRKTAGEVRFIKDRGGDTNEWGWGNPGPSEREIQEGFNFNPKYLKPLALTMRSALMALGHATSAHARFVKVKSRNVSPDGSLGGKGYIQKIPDMRRQLMNTIEALSSLTDTIHDELNAPHWNPAENTLDARDREQVKEIVENADEIREDPEGWAADQEEEMDEENESANGPSPKTATSAHRVLQRYARRTDEGPSWGTPSSYTQAPKMYPEFWSTLNEVDTLLIAMKSAARQVGYWTEGARGDLRKGSLDLDTIDAMTVRAGDLADALVRPLRSMDAIKSRYRSKLATSSKLATPLSQVRDALHAIEPQILMAGEVATELRNASGLNELNQEVADFVGDLRAASKYLRQSLENYHV